MAKIASLEFDQTFKRSSILKFDGLRSFYRRQLYIEQINRYRCFTAFKHIDRKDLGAVSLRDSLVGVTPPRGADFFCPLTNDIL